MVELGLSLNVLSFKPAQRPGQPLHHLFSQRLIMKPVIGDGLVSSWPFLLLRPGKKRQEMPSPIPSFPFSLSFPMTAGKGIAVGMEKDNKGKEGWFQPSLLSQLMNEFLAGKNLFFLAARKGKRAVEENGYNLLTTSTRRLAWKRLRGSGIRSFSFSSYPFLPSGNLTTNQCFQELIC